MTLHIVLQIYVSYVFVVESLGMARCFHVYAAEQEFGIRILDQKKFVLFQTDSDENHPRRFQFC